MKKLCYNVLLIVLMLFGAKNISAQCANTANIYTFSYGGHSYEIVKEMKNWVTAAACAVERGGYLVIINDQAEQTYVYSQIQAAGVSSTYTQVPDGGGTAYIWIGATDKVTEGNWKWDSTNSGSGVQFWSGQGAAGSGGGSAVGGAFYNWGGKSTSTVKEPDDYGSNQDAAAIALAGWPSGTTMLGIGGEWNDISLTNSIYFIIEKNGSTSCVAPASLNSHGITTVSAKISWTSAAPNFSVRYKTSASSTWTTVSSTNDTLELTGLTKNTAYDFQVKAICSTTPSDTSAWSAVANFTTLNDAGISEHSENQINIYPNPSSGSESVFIDNSLNTIEQVILFDIAGREVIKNSFSGQNKVEINISGIPTGIYNLRISTSDKKISFHKLVVE